MKTLLILVLSVISLQSYAKVEAPAIECTNGQIGEDTYMQVNLNLDRSVSFQQHESFMEATPADVVVSGNTVAILNKDLAGSAEGEEYIANTNALLVYDRDTKTMNVTIVTDGVTVVAGEVFSCK